MYSSTYIGIGVRPVSSKCTCELKTKFRQLLTCTSERRRGKQLRGTNMDPQTDCWEGLQLLAIGEHAIRLYGKQGSEEGISEGNSNKADGRDQAPGIGLTVAAAVNVRT